jgi:microcystin-dependent protein
MTFWTPGWMQDGEYTAQHDRLNSRAADWDEGVADRLALKVTQRAAGANLSVDIAAGDAIVTGDDQVLQGNYTVRNDAVFNLTGFAAPGSNSRYDLVGVQLNDPNAGGAAGANAVPVRVAGTPAASPVIPAIPASFLVLAVIGPIVPLTTTITTAMIHDAHTGTGPAGAAAVRLLAGFRDTPGTSKETHAAVAPNGWLMENGQAVSRATYARLFEELGTRHGAGDGASTFNVPDSRGRVGVTVGGVGVVAGALGAHVGEASHVLTAAETAVKGHSGTTGGANARHTHSSPTGTYANTTTGTTGTANYSALGVTGPDSPDHGHNFTVADGANGAAHNIVQPSILVNRIIRT